MPASNAVIAMLAIGNGTEQAIVGEIEGIGTNLLFVATNYEDVKKPEPLTIGDADALGDSLLAPSIAAASPVVQGQAELTNAGEVKNAALVGVTENYAIVQTVELSEGEFFDSTQVSGLAFSDV